MNFVRPTPRTYAGELVLLPIMAVFVAQHMMYCCVHVRIKDDAPYCSRILRGAEARQTPNSEYRVRALIRLYSVMLLRLSNDVEYR